MTVVIRITFSLLAVVTLATISADADGQIFRRMRDNVRTSYPRQVLTAPQPQRPVQVIPQQRGQVAPSLTPYSRLTPEERNAATAAQPVRNLIPANPNVSPDQVSVRVVTYYDPRTGRTYQRRFIIPANNNAVDQAANQKIAGAISPEAGQSAPRKQVYDKIPKPIVANPPQQLNPRPSISIVQQPNVQQPKFNIPAIKVEQTPTRTQQTPATTPQLPMPILAGPPTMEAPVASPIVVTPSVPSPTVQVAPTPSVAFANEPINDTEDFSNEIVIDTAIEPATATSDSIEIGSPASAASVDGTQTAFSVLETPDDNASSVVESSDLDIEINSADEVEAFFGE